MDSLDALLVSLEEEDNIDNLLLSSDEEEDKEEEDEEEDEDMDINNDEGNLKTGCGRNMRSSKNSSGFCGS